MGCPCTDAPTDFGRQREARASPGSETLPCRRSAMRGNGSPASDNAPSTMQSAPGHLIEDRIKPNLIVGLFAIRQLAYNDRRAASMIR